MISFESLSAAEQSGTTYERLDTLAKKLACEIDACDDVRNMPGLARQYRETVRARDEYEPPEVDELAAIVGGVDAVR